MCDGWSVAGTEEDGEEAPNFPQDLILVPMKRLWNIWMMPISMIKEYVMQLYLLWVEVTSPTPPLPPPYETICCVCGMHTQSANKAKYSYVYAHTHIHTHSSLLHTCCWGRWGPVLRITRQSGRRWWVCTTKRSTPRSAHCCGHVQTSARDKSVNAKYFIILCGKFRSPYLGMATAATKAVLLSPTSVCSIFICPNNCMAA